VIPARLLVIALVAFAYIVLFPVWVTLPVLSLISLVAWAVLASLAALVYRRRSNTE
jgi:hypothetical protein